MLGGDEQRDSGPGGGESQGLFTSCALAKSSTRQSGIHGHGLTAWQGAWPIEAIGLGTKRLDWGLACLGSAVSSLPPREPGLTADPLASQALMRKICL